MRQIWKLVLVVAGVAALAGNAAAGSEDHLLREKNPGHGARIAKMYSGEVVVKSDENHVTIAIDDANAESMPDGVVDHVLSLWILRPLLGSETLSLRDFSGDVELRNDRVRVLLHTEEREIQFLMHGAEKERRPRKPSYSQQSFPEGVEFFEYSGEVAEKFSPAEVQREGMRILPALTSSTIPPFNPAPEPEFPGSSCAASCSKTCAFGSCTASCIPGHCAKCSCLGDPATIFPSCQCV